MPISTDMVEDTPIIKVEGIIDTEESGKKFIQAFNQLFNRGCSGFLKCPMCDTITPCSADDLGEYLELGMPSCCNSLMVPFAGQPHPTKACAVIPLTGLGTSPRSPKN